MNCNCIEEYSETIKGNFLKLNDAVSAVNYVLIPQTLSEPKKVGIQFTICYDLKLQNGKVKTKEKTQTLIANFCPFCGKLYPK